MGVALDRRNFLKGIAVSAAGVAGMGALASCAPQSANGQTAGSATYADMVSWNGEYDVVVVGFGAAGAVAAKSAAEAGAGVLLLDKAPEGNEGGNSRYCGQLFAYGNGDVEATRAYYAAMYDELPLPDDVFEVFTEGIAHLAENYAESYGLDKNGFVEVTAEKFPMAGVYSPEYPEFPGSDKMRMWLLHEGAQDGYMWSVQRKSVVDLRDKIDVWFESPATKLIQDPQSKIVVGVEVQRKGETVRIRAKNGVVLTCGGFENNREMVKDHLGIASYAPMGTLYNTGDGIRMATEVGADLWHMHAFEAMFLLGGMSYKVPEGERAAMINLPEKLHMGSSILVGTDGYRYMREDEISRHGHVYRNGVWESPKHPTRCFLVWDQAKADEIAEAGKLPASAVEQVVSAGSLAELAGMIGTKEGVLEQTVADFNQAAEAGHDVALNRAATTMRAFDSGSYYALEVIPDILNTQGGPRRSAKAEVLDLQGEPIPHLYSAGECGGVASNMYQGGSNMAECMIFGQIAGKNAAEAKDDLPAFDTSTFESELAFTLGVETDVSDASEEASYETAEGEYVGKGEGIGGSVVVKVRMDGSMMADIEVLEQNETPDVGGKALESLPDMVLEAQSVDIDAISGATVTSKAFFAAVAEAVAQA